jgi:hypothetical protein
MPACRFIPVARAGVDRPLFSLPPCRGWCVVVLALIAIGLGDSVSRGKADEVLAADAATALRVDPAGIVNAPGEVVEADGSRHAVSELSGIAWLGGDAYAAVMDGSDRLLFLTVTPTTDGMAPTVTFERSLPLDRIRDWEDLAIFTRPDGRRRWFFVEEDTPAVREFAEADGDRPAGAGPRPLGAAGMASLVGPFRSARANRGPEALAIEPDGSRLWTANEEPLERDGPPVASGVAGKVRLVGLAIDDARAIGAEAIERRREVIYEVDPPHDRVSLGGGPLYSGVVALVALGEGRLLVLERSAAAGVPPLENRIYLVDTSTAAESRDRKGNLAAVAPVAKTLLWKGALGVNLEGLCAGPRLADGRLTLVAVADNGADNGVGRRPNPVACFFLTSP